jgi:DNA-binding transcriptional LysR family regulator
MQLNLNKLEVFLEAGRASNYAVASRRLHVTPSAVSHAIRKLESSVGHPLVEWRGKHLALTDEGAFLHAICCRVFDELDEAGRQLAHGAVGVAQHAMVGATVEFGSTVLLRKLRPMLDANPWLHVDFHFSHDLIDPLLRDELDLIVDCRPHHHPEVQSKSLFREKYVVVASPDFLTRHPLHAPRELERVPVLSTDKDGAWWSNMLRALPSHRRPVFRRIVEINHIRGMIYAAMDGYGVALVPWYSVLLELSQGSLVALFPKLQLLEDRFCIYQRRSKAERPKNKLITQQLLDIDIQEFGGALGEMRR